jgi:hypothetical protein
LIAQKKETQLPKVKVVEALRENPKLDKELRKDYNGFKREVEFLNDRLA